MLNTNSHGVTLKCFKFAAFASEETNCFEADVYINGKKAGAVHNDGHGGCNFYHPWTLQTQLNDIASKLPDLVDDKYLIDGAPMVLKMDADLLIDDLVSTLLVERDVKRLVKDKIAMVCADGQIRQTKKLPATQMQALLAMGQEALLKRWTDAVKILNLMPLQDAVQAYRKAA